MRAGRVMVCGMIMAMGSAMSVAAHAQSDTRQQGTQPPPRMHSQRGEHEGGRGQDRAQLMREIRQSFTRAVRTQVGLSDDQMHLLAPINQKYGRQRQDIAQQERAARAALREELSKPSPDQNVVAQLSDKLQSFPRQRLDLNDAEDKELGGVMTPVQLARYRALQERVQRQLDLMRPPMGGARGAPPPDDTASRRSSSGG